MIATCGGAAPLHRVDYIKNGTVDARDRAAPAGALRGKSVSFSSEGTNKQVQTVEKIEMHMLN